MRSETFITLAFAVAAAGVLVLTACGGGGSSTPVVQPPDPPVQEPDPPDPGDDDAGLEPVDPPPPPPVTMTRFPDGFVAEGFTEPADFGLWAKIGDDTLFQFFVILPGAPVHSGGAVVLGGEDAMLSRSRPVGGSAVWTGQAMGYDKDHFRHQMHQPYVGSARLEMDFATTTIDAVIDLPQLAGDPFSWQDVPVRRDGTFKTDEYVSRGPVDPPPGATDWVISRTSLVGVNGAFFGGDHQGAAGSFSQFLPEPSRTVIEGIFGALRE